MVYVFAVVLTVLNLVFWVGILFTMTLVDYLSRG